MRSNIDKEIEAIANKPDMLRDKDVFLLRVLKNPTKTEIKIPGAIKSPINVVAQELLDVLERVLVARIEAEPFDVNCREQIKKRLTICWGYDEMAVERFLQGALGPESKQHHDCTLIATLIAISKWANSYCKDLDRDEYFLRHKVVDFIVESSEAIVESAPKIGAEYRRRCKILRVLAESMACKLDPDDVYWLTAGPKNKRLTITHFSQDDGKAAILPENPDLNHLADWKLEQVTVKKDKVNANEIKFTIKPKVFLKLNLTSEVSDRCSLVLSQKRGVTAEWSIYKHRNQKPERYAILNDASDCLLSSRDKEPLAQRLDDEEGVWVWSLKKSQTS